MRVLYLIADCLAWLAGDVVKYRRKVVHDNLRSSFPDKSEEWIDRTSRDFYHFLADYFVETVKLTSISSGTMKRRMHFENTEEVNEILKSGRSISVFLGHYCNWEWVSSLPLWLPDGSVAGQIYHPLENRAADRLFLKIRERFGAHSIPMKETLQSLLKWRNEGRASITGYIADQAPGYDGIHLFTDFLNHDTPVFTGAERISRMLGCAAFYARISRPERGMYVCRFVKITDNAADLPKFELTRTYFRMLEEQITENPALWLWSHRRWKRDREGFMRYHGDQTERQLKRL